MKKSFYVLAALGFMLVGALIYACGDGTTVVAYSNNGQCYVQVGPTNAYFGTYCPSGFVMTGFLNGQLICGPLQLICY